MPGSGYVVMAQGLGIHRASNGSWLDQSSRVTTCLGLPMTEGCRTPSAKRGTVQGKPGQLSPCNISDPKTAPPAH